MASAAAVTECENREVTRFICFTWTSPGSVNCELGFNATDSLGESPAGQNDFLVTATARAADAARSRLVGGGGGGGGGFVNSGHGSDGQLRRMW